MNKTKAVQPLSENTRKAIIITAIVAVAIIILSVALALILRPEVLSPSDQNTPSNSTSSAPIRNGDFTYTSSDDTSYPKAAQNWTRYGYKAVSGSTHDFESISTNEKAVMGIIDTAEDDDDAWPTVVDDLENAGITGIKNPGVHEGIEAEDTKVYMIATKEATTASILSDSTSISSGKSIKITIWLNTAQLAEGSNAVIMIQKSTVSAKAENWYAYNFEIGKSDESQDNGWQKFEFHIFNRESSTKYIRVSIGIGNVYSGEEGLDLVGEDGKDPITGEGILFVDDIIYEEVTANDYRNVVDGDTSPEHSYKIIENEDITDDSIYLGLDGEYDSTFETAEQYYEDTEYSPFTNRDDFFRDDDSEDAEEGARVESGFTIYKLSHDGSDIDEAISLRLNASALNKNGSNNINVLSSLTQKDHHHISFWIRVTQDNKVAKANIYVQKMNEEGEWEDLTSGSWTKQVTSQEIETDSNAGWVKYDIYLKPSAVQTEISILFVFGSNEYTENDKKLGLFPDGDMYVTSPAYEKISYKDYNNASSGTYVKKFDMLGSEATATTTVTNGSFSTINNTGTQPSSWTPSFAGDNTIYRDGKDNEEIAGITRYTSSIEGSGVIQSFAETSGIDDKQQNVLHIKNNVDTSFGYFSANITLSAQTAYVFSVLVKANNSSGNPYIYLLNTDTELERSDRVITEVTSKYADDLEIDDASFGQYSDELENGWTRYYIVVVTGSESQTVRLVLFNGSLDGKTLETGSIYYDNVTLNSFGTYSLVDKEDVEEGEEPTHYDVKWNDGTYGKNYREMEKEGLLNNIAHVEPTAEEWEEITLIPETPEESDSEPEDNNNPTEREPVDIALLFSIISSVALVAALLVVVVVKFFRSKSSTRKAA